MNALFITGELAVSTTVSSILATAYSLDDLKTVLITFAVSLVSVVGGELIKFLVEFFKNKTQEQKKKQEEQSKDEEE